MDNQGKRLKCDRREEKWKNTGKKARRNVKMRVDGAALYVGAKETIIDRPS